MKLYWQIPHVFSAALLTAVIWILNGSYQGEFQILYTGIWIFILFSILINSNALIFLSLTIIEKVKKKQFQIKENPIILIISLVWNFLLTILLLIIMVFLGILVIDYVGIFLVLILSLPFFAFSVMFLANDVKALVFKIKKRDIETIKGLAISGLLFFLLFGSFGLKFAFFNPQWSEGIDYKALYVKNEAERDYRIPALLALPGDIILSFIESRENAMLDWGDIDLVMKRSTDGGQTWSDIIILRDEGTHTAGNPCPVFDNDTQTVWLPYCFDNKQVFVMNSTDYGSTWSAPKEITVELDLELSGSISQLDMEYGTGPGNGIQMSTGRLIIPSYYFDSRGSHVIYSDDHGATWQKGANLNLGGECQVFEAVNGSLCISCRTTEAYRYVALSSDGGETWNEPFLDSDLPEIGCMASIIRFSSVVSESRNRILYSSPTQGSRGHLTVRISYDEGKTWNVSKLIYEGPSAYSHLIVLSDYTICILFEQGHYDYRESIQFCRFTLTWLTEGLDNVI